MPDIETVTPASSVSSKVRNKKLKKKKISNPFLDNDSVVNPFINYGTPKSERKVSKVESKSSSTSTLFDDSNPFKRTTNNKQVTTIKVKPPTPKRISSLIKCEDETDIGEKTLQEKGKIHYFLP